MIKSLKNNFVDWDIRLLRAIYFSSERYLVNKSMIFFTKSADGIWYFIMGIGLILINYIKGINFAILVLIAFFIEIIFQKTIKIFVKRNRPGWVIDGISFLINPPDKFSFPSGHTAGAFIIALAFLKFFPLSFPLVLIWAIFVAISRVYNGVHYPSDVFAGSVLGTISWYFTLYLDKILSLSPFI